MSSTQKPESLRLADKYEAHGFLGDHSFAKEQWCSQAAAELRRQHARIAELEAQLSAIGAGGVEPLRKQASTADVADERDAFEKWLRIKPCGAAHDFGWEDSLPNRQLRNRTCRPGAWPLNSLPNRQLRNSRSVKRPWPLNSLPNRQLRNVAF